MGPSKDKHGVRESFAKVIFFIREEWPFPDKGILIKTNNICKYVCIYMCIHNIYIYVYINHIYIYVYVIVLFVYVHKYVDDSPFLLVQFSFELPWLRRYAQ